MCECKVEADRCAGRQTVSLNSDSGGRARTHLGSGDRVQQQHCAPALRPRIPALVAAANEAGAGAEGVQARGTAQQGLKDGVMGPRGLQVRTCMHAC